jgi:hypothetical protein
MTIGLKRDIDILYCLLKSRLSLGPRPHRACSSGQYGTAQRVCVQQQQQQQQAEARAAGAYLPHGGYAGLVYDTTHLIASKYFELKESAANREGFC